MAHRPLIIDCDPGVDDAIALLLALACLDEFRLLGITTVAGNVPLELTAHNALRICQLAGHAEIPVFAGCPRPLLQPLLTAEHVHGLTGLDGAVLPEPKASLADGHAVTFLIEQLLKASEPITLAALGPLTNLAVAIVQCPAIAAAIGDLVIMGGSMTHGNVTPSAEFNIYVDPHAASIVFAAGIPITLIGLDVTHQVVTTPERLAAIRQLGTPVAQAAHDLLKFYGQLDAERYGLAGSPLHDPCVIAYLLQPELFSGRPMAVTIETISPLSLGRTIVDPFPTSADAANALVLESVQAEEVYHLLVTKLAKL